MGKKSVKQQLKSSPAAASMAESGNSSGGAGKLYAELAPLEKKKVVEGQGNNVRSDNVQEDVDVVVGNNMREKEVMLAMYNVPTAQPATSVDERDQDTPDEWVNRRPEMLRLTGLHPFNSEPPLQTLMDQGFITPPELHYVRNHGPVPKLSWETHRVEVFDVDGQPVGSLSMDDLVEKFQHRSLPITLTCAGNRRKEENMVRKSNGFSWGCGACSTSVWTGVRLGDILDHFGLLSDPEKVKRTKWINFEGVDDLPKGKYGTSLALATAIDPARDVLIAFEQNGERLTPDHGFPVRVIIPGFIGGRMVKWLGKISASAVESESFYHYFDNRVLPSQITQDSAPEVQEAAFRDPSYIINDRNINSVISSPAHEEELVLGESPETYNMRGYAYNGGGRRITRIEVSFDYGATWEMTSLTQPERPNAYGRYYCWSFWDLQVDPKRFLDTKEVMVRAWDESNNTQPTVLNWNLLGMMNSVTYRVKIMPIRSDKRLALKFIHPAPIEGGGWMEKKKPATNPVADAQAKGDSSTKDLPKFTLSEVAKHNTKDDCWIILHGRVCDVTSWIADHPGGETSVITSGGKDVSDVFDVIHSEKAQAMVKDYVIGMLQGEPSKI